MIENIMGMLDVMFTMLISMGIVLACVYFSFWVLMVAIPYLYRRVQYWLYFRKLDRRRGR